MNRRRIEGADIGLLILRVMLGIAFLYHGSQKMFGLFGGPGLQGFAGYVSGQMGVPAVLGYAAAFCEFGGGILVLLGVLAEVGGLMISAVMLVAITQHFANGYGAGNNGYELPFDLLLAALAVVAAGPGRIALWNPIHRRRTREGDEVAS